MVVTDGEKEQIINELKTRLKNYDYLTAPYNDLFLMSSAILRYINYHEVPKLATKMTKNNIFELVNLFLKKTNIRYYDKFADVMEKNKICIYKKEGISEFDDRMKPLEEIKFLSEYFIKTGNRSNGTAPIYKAFFPLNNNLEDVFDITHEVGHILCYDNKEAKSWDNYFYFQELVPIFFQLILIDYLLDNYHFSEEEIKVCILPSLNSVYFAANYLYFMILLKFYNEYNSLNMRTVDNGLYPPYARDNVWKILPILPISEQYVAEAMTYVNGYFYAIQLKKAFDINPHDTMIRIDEFIDKIGNISIDKALTLLKLNEIDYNILGPYSEKIKIK